MKKLTEVVMEYQMGKIDKSKLGDELKGINVFKVGDATELALDDEDVVNSIGDGNSWFEVSELLNNNLVTEEKVQDVYRELKRLELI